MAYPLLGLEIESGEDNVDSYVQLLMDHRVTAQMALQTHFFLEGLKCLSCIWYDHAEDAMCCPSKDRRCSHSGRLADSLALRRVASLRASLPSYLAEVPARCVLDLKWLRMFDARELGIIISGSSAGFDVADLKENTVYNGGFTVTRCLKGGRDSRQSLEVRSCEDRSPVIRWLWDLLENGLDSEAAADVRRIFEALRPCAERTWAASSCSPRPAADRLFWAPSLLRGKKAAGGLGRFSLFAEVSRASSPSSASTRLTTRGGLPSRVDFSRLSDTLLRSRLPTVSQRNSDSSFRICALLLGLCAGVNMCKSLEAASADPSCKFKDTLLKLATVRKRRIRPRAQAYTSQQMLRDKLLQAIRSESGFDLS